jgi:hypothetical protein
MMAAGQRVSLHGSCWWLPRCRGHGPISSLSLPTCCITEGQVTEWRHAFVCNPVPKKEWRSRLAHNSGERGPRRSRLVLVAAQPGTKATVGYRREVLQKMAGNWLEQAQCFRYREFSHSLAVHFFSSLNVVPRTLCRNPSPAKSISFAIPSSLRADTLSTRFERTRRFVALKDATSLSKTTDQMPRQTHFASSV